MFKISRSWAKLTWIDWAGGPGDSKEDVEWLDKRLASFFETTILDSRKLQVGKD